jgi:hypothetical protein
MAIGLLIAGGVHGVKSLAIRPAVTVTTGGTGNVPVSMLEDVVATITSIVSVVAPVVITCVVILVTAWILLWMWRRFNRESQGVER